MAPVTASTDKPSALDRFIDGLSEPAFVLALAAFALLVLLPGAGSPSQITRGDVYRFVLRAAVGMNERGDYLTPHMGAWIDFSKPPLFHWLIAFGLRRLSNPFLASRLPGALCAAGTVLLTYAFGLLWGLARRRSAAAALLWLGTSAMAVYGRQPLLEAPLALAMMGSFYGLCRACERESPAWLLLFGAALGASEMVKWVVGPLTIGIFAAVYLLLSGRWRWLLRRPAWALAALALAAAVAVPWPAYMAALHREAFTTQLRKELIGDRFNVPTSVGDFLGHGLLLGLLPWTLLLLPALADVRRLKDPIRSGAAAWVISGFLPTLLIASRTSRYSFPAMPGLCLVLAALIEADRASWRLSLRATAVVIAAVFVPTVAACLWLGLLGPAAGLLAVLVAGVGVARLWQGDAFAGAAAACLLVVALVGPAVEAVGFNAVPERIVQAIGTRPVARYHEQPQAAGTGYLQLYLGRDVEIYWPGALSLASARRSLLVASGDSLAVLQEDARAHGFTCPVLETWESPHTNPPPKDIWAALRARSLAPLQVTHYLVDLRPIGS